MLCRSHPTYIVPDAAISCLDREVTVGELALFIGLVRRLVPDFHTTMQVVTHVKHPTMAVKLDDDLPFRVDGLHRAFHISDGKAFPVPNCHDLPAMRSWIQTCAMPSTSINPVTTANSARSTVFSRRGGDGGAGRT